MTELNKNQQTSPQNSSENKAEKGKFFCFKNIKSRWKSYTPSKSFTLTMCFLLGVGGTLLAQNISQSKSRSFAHHHTLPFYGDQFFESDSAFEEMFAMEERMDEIFNNHRKRMREVFRNAPQTSDRINKSGVSRQEDNDSYTYELSFSGFKKEDVSVSVKNNIVTFSAEKKNESDEKNKTQRASSSFHYSFLAPEYDTKKEPEITRKDDAIIVKLSKKK